MSVLATTCAARSGWSAWTPESRTATTTPCPVVILWTAAMSSADRCHCNACTSSAAAGTAGSATVATVASTARNPRTRAAAPVTRPTATAGLPSPGATGRPYRLGPTASTPFPVTCGTPGGTPPGYPHVVRNGVYRRAPAGGRGGGVGGAPAAAG